MAHRIGRPRAEARTLSKERAVAAALAIVDAGGMEALTMRRLAAELDVDPMAIYHHLPNKRALVRALVAEVFGGLNRSLARMHHGDWRDRVRAFARAYLGVARAHPGLVLHLVTEADAATTEIAAASEVLYAALADAGLDARRIVAAADLIVDWLNGVALALPSLAFGPGDRSAMRALLDGQPADAVPVLRRVYTEGEPDVEGVDLELALDLILAGIEARTATR